MTVVYSPVTGDFLVYEFEATFWDAKEAIGYESMSTWIVPGTLNFNDA